MNGILKGFVVFAGSIFLLVLSYQLFRIADTWEKRNTDDLVQGLWIAVIFALMMIVVALAIVLAIRMAIKSRLQPAGYDDDYAPAPRQGRGQQQQAYPYDYNVPAGQPMQRALPGPQGMGTQIPWMQGPQGQQQGYGTPYGQQPGYGFAPMPPPAGQLSSQGAQYDLNGNVGW